MELTGEDFYREVRRIFEEVLPEKLNSPVRSGQVEMALAVARAFEEKRILAVEAGTGVGKSLAYLVPALLWRICGGGVAPIASTKTINLQEQLMHKDIPFLKELFYELYDVKLRVAQARGVSNYLCRRRFLNLYRNNDHFSPEENEWLKNIATVIERAEDKYGIFHSDSDEEDILGVFSEFEVPREVWSYVCCDTWQCSKRRCSHYSDCFLYLDRRRLSGADLIVANHSLVLADAALRRDGVSGILPSQEFIIFDEAHHLESVATEQLSYSFTQKECNMLLNKLQDDSGEHRGEESLITRLTNSYIQYSDVDYHQDWASALDRLNYGCLENLRDELMCFFEHLRQAFSENFSDSNTRGIIDDELLQHRDEREVSLREEADSLALSLSECGDILEEILFLIIEDEDNLMASFADDVTSARDYVHRLRDSLNHCVDLSVEGWINWAEKSQQSRFDQFNGERIDFVNVGLKVAPLSIGEYLNTYMFKDVSTLVLTSATLKVRNNMDFFLSSIGLGEYLNIAIEAPKHNAKDDGEIKKLKLPLDTLCCQSPFNYRYQALMGIARGLPDLTVANFLNFCEATIEPLAKLITALRGRTLILFTSYGIMYSMGKNLAKRLANEGIEVLIQGQCKMSRAQMVEKLRDGSDTVLLGTDSFWEGVDVQGEALQCVIITKLPFVVPDEPIHKARMECIKRQGGNDFLAYQIPLLITKMRQGVGRLIRSQSDRGIILILDSRLHTKYYGREVINSLPPCTMQTLNLSDLIDNSLAWMGIDRNMGHFFVDR